MIVWNALNAKMCIRDRPRTPQEQYEDREMQALKAMLFGAKLPPQEEEPPQPVKPAKPEKSTPAVPVLSLIHIFRWQERIKRIQANLERDLFDMVKRTRAQGECLGTGSR